MEESMLTRSLEMSRWKMREPSVSRWVELVRWGDCKIRARTLDIVFSQSPTNRYCNVWHWLTRVHQCYAELFHTFQLKYIHETVTCETQLLTYTIVQGMIYCLRLGKLWKYPNRIQWLLNSVFSASTGDIHLVRIRSFPEYSCSLPADYGLSRLCTGTVQIHYVDGSHESMMHSPQVEAVIAAVQTALKASHCWIQWLVGVGVFDITLVTVHCKRCWCLVGVGVLDVTLVTVYCGRWWWVWEYLM